MSPIADDLIGRARLRLVRSSPGEPIAYDRGELVAAALCHVEHVYRSRRGVIEDDPPSDWPFERESWWAPDESTGIAAAIALLTAELDRLQTLNHATI